MPKLKIAIVYRMPSIHRGTLLQLHDDYNQYPCFVETGTLNGGTIFGMEPFFDTLYTIEVSERYYNGTKNRYKGNKITFLLGDSSKVLGDVVPTLAEPTIFFLDGHWSSGDTGRGEKDCPLVEEITHIATAFKHKAIIIVDDFRLFGLGPPTGVGENWMEIRKDTLLEILGTRVGEVYHLDSECAKDDRLIIHIHAA